MVARQDFNFPEQLKPMTVIGRNFWVRLHIPRQVSDHFLTGLRPEFKNIVQEICEPVREPKRHLVQKGPDGRYRIILPELPATDLPFSFYYSNNRYSLAPQLLLNEPVNDLKQYQEWKKRYPNFLGVHAGEWDSELSAFANRTERFVKSGTISPADKAKILEQYPLPANEGELERAKKYFERQVRFFFHDPAKITLMHSWRNMGHLAGELGAGGITLETTNTYHASGRPRWQISMAYTRGAARQYQIPWTWYIASYYHGYTEAGEPQFDSEVRYWPLTAKKSSAHGISLSAIRRCMYLTYLSGANFMQRECWLNTWREKDGTITPRGKIYLEFAEFIKKNPDRGIPYTPIALLVSYASCYPATGGFAMDSYRYRPGDFMADAFTGTIIPGFDRQSALKRGEEGGLYNTPYGDVFDVLAPDSRKREKFAAALSAYKAAILIGEYARDPEMVDIFKKYVAAGGTLVVSTAQLDGAWTQDFTGINNPISRTIKSGNYTLDEAVCPEAKPIAFNARQQPILLRRQYGNGALIFATPQYMVPEFNNAITTIEQVRAGKIQFEYVEQLLTRLISETLPVKVRGNIQYGLNKTADGWLIYLFNNQGVIKYTDKPQKVLPDKRATVIIDLQTLKNLKVQELISGKAVTANHGTLTVEVESGDIAILKLQENQ